jgi:hypothetical protein
MIEKYKMLCIQFHSSKKSGRIIKTPVVCIRIRVIHTGMFFGLPDPDPSSSKQKNKENLDFSFFVTSLTFYL